MKANGVEALIVPTDDPHGSEYLADHWQCRRWLTGFTGSAGDAVVTQDEALLWTDSRYWLQAEEQLADTEFCLMRETVDVSIEEWLKQKGLKGYRSFEEPFDEIWKDRPALPLTRAWHLEDEIAGETAESKLRRLNRWLTDNSRESVLVSDLSEVCWLLNIRADDIAFTPFIICFLKVYATGRRVLYVNDCQIEGIREYLKGLNIGIQEYENAPREECCDTPVTEWKSIKNPVEQQGFRDAHLHDGVAMVRFLHRLDDICASDEPMPTEIGLDKMLTALRREEEGFIDLSFETIAGYAAHGAIVHYEATQETDIQLERKGFVLLDSGAHYNTGTTDITRTIALGPLTEEERRVYTLVLKGHLQLQNLKFPDGTTGLQLDTAARMAMWREGYDFGHGTGHGVGHILCVHEGPMQIRKNCRKDTILPMHAGQTMTDEPGVYVTGRFGVRIENTLLSRMQRQTDFGNFLEFEPLTLCPYDRRAIVTDLLTTEEKRWIDDYHKMVCERLLPLLKDESDRLWLQNATLPL